MSYIDTLISNYYSKGIIVDTNLLLLFLIGIYDINYIQSFKRTSKYNKEDYEIVNRIINSFSKIIVTPHIIAEFSNLSFQLPEKLLENYFKSIFAHLNNIDEIYIPKNVILGNQILFKIGFTDLSIIELSKNKTHLVFTDDLPLTGYLNKFDCDLINLNYIRTELWLRK